MEFKDLLLKATLRELARIVAYTAETVSAAAAQNNDDKNNPNAPIIVVSPKHRYVLSPRFISAFLSRGVVLLRKPSVGYAYSHLSAYTMQKSANGLLGLL